jgi:peptide deformylase
METIIRYPDGMLLKKSSVIVQFGPETAAVAEKLKRLMKVKNGVGLSAVQVGSPIRLAAIRNPENHDNDGEPLILANPRVVRSEGSVSASEGCLSIPGIWLEITRPMEVEVESDLPGGDTRRHVFREYLARGIMHEIDHMEGLLIWDHLPPRGREEAINRFLESERRIT